MIMRRLFARSDGHACGVAASEFASQLFKLVELRDLGLRVGEFVWVWRFRVLGF